MNLKSLLCILSINFLTCGVFGVETSSAEIVAETLTARLTVTAYADTETEAYVAAKAKVPSGAKEIKVRFRKAGSRVLCLLTYEKK